MTHRTAIIHNHSNDPSYNLALEEYLLTGPAMPETCIMLWQNEPSVIIGRNQNTYDEINQDFIEKNKINVIRRITGGGAVYHDLGNVNFSFVGSAGKKKIDFARYNEIIVDVLLDIGVKAELNSRNDIAIEGKKFSGTAQYIHGNKVLHHGTLLFDTCLDTLEDALRVGETKYQSKGVKSVRSRVTNISSYLLGVLSAGEFKNLLLQKLCEALPSRQYALTNVDLENIMALQKEKYCTWEWNYGSSPQYNFKKTCNFSCGQIEVRLKINEGCIKKIKVYGDFFGIKEMADFENHFVDLTYNTDTVYRKLSEIALEDYFGSVCADELIQCFYK